MRNSITRLTFDAAEQSSASGRSASEHAVCKSKKRGPMVTNANASIATYANDVSRGFGRASSVSLDSKP